MAGVAVVDISIDDSEALEMGVGPTRSENTARPTRRPGPGVLVFGVFSPIPIGLVRDRESGQLTERTWAQGISMGGAKR